MQPLQSWTWKLMSVSRSWQGGDTPSSGRVCLAWQDLVCAEQQSLWWVLGVGCWVCWPQGLYNSDLCTEVLSVHPVRPPCIWLMAGLQEWLVPSAGVVLWSC
jgi:hypothetical protein